MYGNKLQIPLSLWEQIEDRLSKSNPYVNILLTGNKYKHFENHEKIYIILLKSLNIVFVFCHLRLQEEKMKLQLNLTVQFLLRQGQVELESTEIPDYTDAILINKSVIEELNRSIMVIYII